MKIRPTVLFVLTAALLAPALAQRAPATSTTRSAPATSTLSLGQALSLAYTQGPTLTSAQTTLQNAQATLRARQGDPSTLVADLTSAQNAVKLAQVNLANARLTVLQSVVNAYLGLYETQQNINLLTAQLNLDQKNLQVAQAKLQARTGTSLDVSKAQNTVNTDQQNLANANAQITVQATELARLFAQSTSTLTLQAPPAPPKLTTPLATLTQGLNARLPSVVQAQQAVANDQLTVQTSNNDYTPRLTLQNAQADLQNDQRTLANTEKTAASTLKDSYSAAQDAYSRIAIQQKAVTNAQTTLTQAQARYKSGIISLVDLQSSQVALQSAKFTLTQAVDTYWKSLAALAAAAGSDVTGLVAKAGQ